MVARTCILLHLTSYLKHEHNQRSERVDGVVLAATPQRDYFRSPSAPISVSRVNALPETLPKLCPRPSQVR